MYAGAGAGAGAGKESGAQVTQCCYPAPICVAQRRQPKVAAIASRPVSDPLPPPCFLPSFSF